jgi:hypothetical protein
MALRTLLGCVYLQLFLEVYLLVYISAPDHPAFLRQEEPPNGDLIIALKKKVLARAVQKIAQA